MGQKVLGDHLRNTKLGRETKKKGGNLERSDTVKMKEHRFWNEGENKAGKFQSTYK